MLGLNGRLLDFIYPVGSYYETSDTSFNPNTAWGGTWVEDTKGRVTVALDSGDSDFDTLGETGGNKTHRHFNGIYAYNSKLAISNNNSEDPHATGNVFTVSGTTGFNSVGAVNTFAYSTENGSSLQPYIVVKRWHRTA